MKSGGEVVGEDLDIKIPLIKYNSEIESSRRRKIKIHQRLFRSPTTISKNNKFQHQKYDQKFLEKEISKNHKAIQEMIGGFQSILLQKLERHEQELLRVYKSTIQKIMIQMNEYFMILKQKQQEFMNQKKYTLIQKELEYFRAESIKLFDLTKTQEKQISRLRISLRKMDEELLTKNQVILKLTKKVVFYKKNLIHETSRMPSIDRQRVQSKSIFNDSRQQKSEIYTHYYPHSNLKTERRQRSLRINTQNN